MLTAKDVREVQFNHSRGGYKTNEVDDFLDQCADTMDALTALNEENKNKMQVLAETVVEYRNKEDSIHFALINAQRMAESVVKEAEEKAAAIVAEAQEKATTTVTDSEEWAANAREATLADIESENAELCRIRKEVADFKAKLLSIYREHLTLIGVLEDNHPQEKTPPASNDEEPPVDEVAVESVVVEEELPVAEEVQQELEEELPAYAGVIPDFSVFELKEDDE